MDCQRLSIVPSDFPPADPRPGEFWVPKSGGDAGELHVWSPKRGGWLNLYDDRIARIRPSLWRRTLARLGVRRA